jgi:hypothetical protein
MKRIIEACAKGSMVANIYDIVKLRLRGRGSGFREGPNKEESGEPLHLCISSKYYDKYSLACHLSQELLLNIYEDFRRFCDKNNRIN